MRLKKKWGIWGDLKTPWSGKLCGNCVNDLQKRIDLLAELAEQDWIEFEAVQEYARRDLRDAVGWGLIVRPPMMEFHHPDYSRPYYGCWVTRKEHNAIHRGTMPCPPCTDHDTPEFREKLHAIWDEIEANKIAHMNRFRSLR